MELVEEARLGVHPPEFMPFSVPWTDAPADQLGVRMLQYYWGTRAAFTPDDWSIHFLVRLDGRVIGTQGLSATRFGVLRAAHTGSWLGMRHQGNGYGAEMRAAVVLFAFDHLGATQVRSDAFVDNAASRAVSRKLGYQEDGSTLVAPRGKPVTSVRLLLAAERFVPFRPKWSLDVTGLDGCRSLVDSGEKDN